MEQVSKMADYHFTVVIEADGKRVTVPVHLSAPVPVGTLRAILRDADIGVDEFLELL